MEFKNPEYNQNNDLDNDWNNPKREKPHDPNDLTDPRNDPNSYYYDPYLNNHSTPIQPKKTPHNPDALNHTPPPTKVDPAPDATAEPTNPFKVSHSELIKHVGSADDAEEYQASKIAKPSTPGKDSPTTTPTPSASNPNSPDLPGLPKTGGSALPKDLKDEFTPKVGSLEDVNVISAPEHVEHIGSKAFTVGKNIYTGKETTPEILRHEIGHFHPKDKATGKIRRWANNNDWQAKERERQRQLEAKRKAEEERKRREAEEVERKRQAAIKAELERKRKAGIAATESKRTAERAAARQKDPNGNHKPVPLKPTDFSEYKAKVRAELKQEQERDRKAKLEKNIAAHPGIKAVLLGAGFGSPLLASSLFKGAAALAHPETKANPDPKADPKAESKPDEPSGFLGGALNLGKNLLSGASHFAKDTFKTGGAALNVLNPLSVAPANAAVSPTLETTASKAPEPEPKKEEGGLFGGLKSFGKDLVDGGKNLVSRAVDAGKNLVDGAKSMGEGALNFAGNAWNGASKWMSDHKAEIAIGVGVIALAGATILTGGAALAVAGAVAGGTAVSAGTVATVVAGGAVAGAGLNLVHQGAAIKDGVIDPETGKKKTDLNYDEVFKSGAIGAVAAPVGAAAFGLAPVAVGGLGLYGGGISAINGVSHLKDGHGWSAAASFMDAGMAFAPMASKGGRQALFGDAAVARTGKTVNAMADKGSEVLSGAKGLLGINNQPTFRPAFAMNGNGGGLTTGGTSTTGKFQPMMMEGNPEGVVPVTSKASTSMAAPKETVPTTTPETDVGLSTRGYRPQPGERSITREQWKAYSSEQRAAYRTSWADQPLENPLPNASRHGHGHADHGHQTTDIQQGNRIRTGIPPSGRTNAPAVSKTSKFNSPRSEAEALGRGAGKLETDIANGLIPPDKRFPDPVTGKPTYVDPATGAPTRHKISVTTDDPNGFGYKIVKQKDPVTGQILKDAAGQSLTIADPTKINSATIIWEYVPSQGIWHPVTYYPQ